MTLLQGLLGLVVFVGLAWLASEDRRRFPWRPAAAGVALQAVLAVLLLKLPPSRIVFEAVNQGVLALQSATKAGTGFVFGYLGGGPLPFEPPFPGAGFILAFQALPLILVVSALTAVLYHWRLLPGLVRAFSIVLERALGVGGAGGIAAAANVFVGMIEAPLLIRPYIARLDRSELFLVMACGMATIAGTVLVVYASILGQVIADPAGHLLTASLMNAPAAIVIARIMVPGEDGGTAALEIPRSESKSTLDAVARGTIDGVGLLINVIAMLVVLLALVHLINLAVGLLPTVGGTPLSLERVLGWVMAPLAWLTGIGWSEAAEAGSLLGVKVVLNEFLAYLRLAELPAGTLSDRSRLIMTYALCGFANFGSLGIMLGGLGAMAPERRAEIAGLGLKSILAGTLATLMTAAMVGLILG